MLSLSYNIEQKRCVKTAGEFSAFDHSGGGANLWVAGHVVNSGFVNDTL